MTVHNYRSRQVHETLNGVNPSSGFRDMRSAKSGSNLWQIWQVFGPSASPYAANGQMSITVHNYRPRQFHRTSNGENPSSGYRDMGSASLAAARPTARPDRDDNTPPTPWLPILVIHIRSKSKKTKSKLQILKKLPKIQILRETFHMTHLLKLLDKMCKYEMDPTRTVGATERTWDAGRTDGQTDGGILIYTPNNFVVWGVW